MKEFTINTPGDYEMCIRDRSYSSPNQWAFESGADPSRGEWMNYTGELSLIHIQMCIRDMFIFAGTGPLEESIKGVSNIKNVGFQKGEALEKLIRCV